MANKRLDINWILADAVKLKEIKIPTIVNISICLTDLTI